MRDDRVSQMQMQINHLNNVKRALRERERNLDARRRTLDGRAMSGTGGTFPANNIQSLKNSLFGNLPSYMIPGNVGGINEVCWPFNFQMDLDLGANPSISDAMRIVKGSFQVDQEAAFILQSVCRSHSTDANGQSATINAPLQIEIIDRQSSRRFNNAPMPLQMIGLNSLPSILPTPMYVQPNAFIDVQVSGIPQDPQTFNGSGLFQLSFFGVRIRIEDAGKVLSTIFAPTY